MPRRYGELQQVASLSRRRHGFDSRTGRQFPEIYRRSAFLGLEAGVICCKPRLTNRELIAQEGE